MTIGTTYAEALAEIKEIKDTAWLVEWRRGLFHILFWAGADPATSECWHCGKRVQADKYPGSNRPNK